MKTKMILILICVAACICMGIIYFSKQYYKRPGFYNCSDFKTYAEALKVYRKHTNDIYHLDADHDGIPCEKLIHY